jgi:hypothetical protein
MAPVVPLSGAMAAGGCRWLSRRCRQVLASVQGPGLDLCRARVPPLVRPMNSPEYGEEDRMTAVAAKPAATGRAGLQRGFGIHGRPLP